MPLPKADCQNLFFTTQSLFCSFNNVLCSYTMRNVARCWAYETAVLTGNSVENTMPRNDYFEYYGPDYLLHIRASNMVRCKFLVAVSCCVLRFGSVPFPVSAQPR